MGVSLFGPTTRARSGDQNKTHKHTLSQMVLANNGGNHDAEYHHMGPSGKLAVQIFVAGGAFRAVVSMPTGTSCRVASIGVRRVHADRSTCRRAEIPILAQTHDAFVFDGDGDALGVRDVVGIIE